MKRRNFLKGLLGAVVAVPAVAKIGGGSSNKLKKAVEKIDSSKYKHVSYGLGFEVSPDAMDDLMTARMKALARSVKHTKIQVMADVLNGRHG